MVNKLFKRHPNYLIVVRFVVGNWVDENTVFRAVSYDKDSEEYVMVPVGRESVRTFRSSDYYFKQGENCRWILVGLGYKNKRRSVCTK